MRARDIAEMRLSDERSALAAQFEPLAHKLAIRFARRARVDLDDATSVAMEALVNAARTWNPQLSKFITHAYKAISLRLMIGDGTNQYRFSIGTQKERNGSGADVAGRRVLRCGDGVMARVAAEPVEMERIEWRDAMEALAPELEALSERDRELLTLRVGHEMDLRRVGERVGLSRQGVKVAVERVVGTIRHRRGMGSKAHTIKGERRCGTG